MTSPINISGIELYDFLGLPRYAIEAEIKKAYRKLALKLHPDKNPGKKNAVQDFQKLQKVFETLTDITKKSKYDQELMAKENAGKKQAKTYAQEQHLRRKWEEKERENLERKKQEERQAKEKELLIQRMREEARIKLERKRQAERFYSKLSDNDGYSIRVSWKTNKKDIEPAYSEEEIKEIFSKFGEILHVVKSKKKEGLYLINYAAKESAVLSTTETGKPLQPLEAKLSFVHANTDHQQISFEDILRKYNINPNEFTDFNNATKKTECKPEKIDKETGLPIKYVYSHGTDTVFACAATFSLPPEIRIEDNGEVVYNGFLVRLWPSEQVKYTKATYPN